MVHGKGYGNRGPYGGTYAKGDARAHYLPKVSMVDFVYTEAVESKKQQVVLGAISRMYARAVADGFSVQRIHTDRGKEFNNSALRAFCQKLGLHQTFAIPEEHQTNGRAEGAILRIKNKTRTILQGAGSDDLNEWPLAAKLAASQLRADARKRLRMPCEPTLPYNTKVQVLKRSWHRGVWDARTTTAFTKCPSTDTSRGWVVRTVEGLMFTTSKVFPVASNPEIKFEVAGQPIDLDQPSHRLKEKSKAKKIQLLDDSNKPKHPADILAKQLLESGSWEPKHIASLAICMSRTMSSNTRMVKTDEGSTEGGGVVSRPTCNFISGGFTFSGMSGVRCDTKDYSYVTRYLCEYMKNYTDEAFAGIGSSLNSCHSMHRDLHNQREVPNLLLPIVTSGGGLWIQDKLSALPSMDGTVVPEVRRSPSGDELQGHVYQYASHQLLKFYPQVWHESVDPKGPQLLLFGFTARGLHKLPRVDRQVLWDTGFPYVPGTKHEYWGYKASTDTIVRYHPVPRRAMFAPTDQDMLPFSRKCLGDVRLCVQQQGGDPPVCSFHRWREGRGRASPVAWTGCSVFKFLSGHGPLRAGNGGGVPTVPTDFSTEQPSESGGSKKLCGTAPASTSEVEGVVEVPHYQERLSLLQNPGLGNGGAEGWTGFRLQEKKGKGFDKAQVAVDSTESGLRGVPGCSRATARSRSRTRGKDDDCNDYNVEPTRGRGLSSGGRNVLDRTVSSPAPICHWGARFAARYRLRSVQVAADSTESSPRGHDAAGLGVGHRGSACRVTEPPSLRCDDLVCGSLVKGVEILTQVGRKVTVCEEFPARCPRNVMYACLTIELRRLDGELQRREIGTEHDRDQEVDPLPYAVPEVLQHLRLCDPSLAEEGVSYSLERTSWEMPELSDVTSEVLAAEHYARCNLLELTGDDVEGWLKGCEEDLIQDIQNLECELRRLKGFEQRALQRLEFDGCKSFERRSIRHVAVSSGLQGNGSPPIAVLDGSAESVGNDVDSDPAPLQTKTIAQEQVRRELAKWREPMGEEVESLVQKPRQWRT